MDSGFEGYLTGEALSRMQIDRRLAAAGWEVQDRKNLNLYAAQGVAVREFTLSEDHGRVDYLLFVDAKAVGSIEAKPLGTLLSDVEGQSAGYVTGLPDDIPAHFDGIKFVYEATGEETQFTNLLDPRPRARRPFTFHRPETLADWIQRARTDRLPPTLRHGLRTLPPLDPRGLWPVQARAINNLEDSFVADHPRALIQMATGSGKTFTAANVAYRLIRHARAVRVLFLVDRANLGRQTLKEFQNFTTPEGRRFTDLYNLQHLTSNTLDPVAKVTISTIQRLYAMLRGRELEGDEDEWSGYERQPAQAVEVEYNTDVPIETFDFIIVDECHRSIYGVWRQVLEYFDAHLIGLTATPSRQTYGFFNQNLVMEYDHAQAVADGVNVDFDVYRIRTRITEEGGAIPAGQWAGFRDRETRAKRWEQLDEPLEYTPEQLDRRVEAPDQIRTVIRTFRDNLPQIFPGRREVPKTLIFAKTDAHADTILQIVRQEFRQGNDFARKITYRSTDDRPENLLAAFRNTFLPRIAVSVDMIATGTDIKPLECLVFMRAPRSRTFFEQMKGRGVRVIQDADLQQVTPDVATKTHFVIVDAVGVTESQLNDTQPLERQRSVPLRRLLESLALGQLKPETLTSVASRLARLDRRLKPSEREELEDLAGRPLVDLTHSLIEAADPDRHIQAARQATGGKCEPKKKDVDQAARTLMQDAVQPLATNPDLRQRLIDIGRSHEQAIDEVSQDELLFAGGSHDAADRARAYTQRFREYLEEHRDEITALQILYNIPWRQRLTFAQIRELANSLETAPQRWTPRTLWAAYQALDRSKVHGSPQRILTDLVSIVRFALGLTPELVAYPELVEVRFRQWLAQQQENGRHFSPEQRHWLDMIRDHVAASLAVTTDDFDFSPFVERGGLGRAAQVFGADLNTLLEELNRELAA